MDARNDAVPRPGFFGGLLSLAGRAVRPFGRLARRVLGPDGDLKVLAVLGALVVYGLVEPLSVGIERTVSVPVRVVPTDKSVAVVGVSPATVSVTLRGTSESSRRSTRTRSASRWRRPRRRTPPRTSSPSARGT